MGTVRYYQDWSVKFIEEKLTCKGLERIYNTMENREFYLYILLKIISVSENDFWYIVVNTYTNFLALIFKLSVIH